MSTWLADIDGTLALKGERGPYDWHRVGEDAPNPPVVELVRALIADGHVVLFVTGRMEECRRQTLLWLDANVAAGPFGELYMRPDEDYRPDDELKREIYETLIRPHHEITGVIDDRRTVVAMWRSLGLTCVQVAPGEF
jgi:hydroxymethylpyrimidine pyrophosphatase-like HAD family hydrolase